MQTSTPEPRSSTTRHLCVDLDTQRYAVPILSVREIQAYSPPTPLPRLPHHVRGVTNLHGDIVPVVDLRLRLGMPEQPYGRLAVIVFVFVATQVVGLIVDAAARVIDIDHGQVRPPPEISDGIDVSFIAGIARISDRVIVVLDVETLLRGDPALAASETLQTAREDPRRLP